MTIRRIHFGFSALFFAALFALCVPVCAQELELQNAEAPRSRLQTFTDRASELAMRALGMIGIRYKYGGGTPELGLDCSGLVRYVYKEAWGLNLPRTSEEISKVGQRVEADDLQAGDLVFFNTLRRNFSHVGIYLGDQKFVHAPAAGGHVRIESMDVGYWKKRFNGARRLNDPQRSLWPALAQPAVMQPAALQPAAMQPNLTTVPAGP
jgi:hypothetical protein